MSNQKSITVGAPVTVTLEEDGTVVVSTDLSEFLDGAREAFEDGGQDFDVEDAEDVDSALTRALRRNNADGSLVLTSALW